MRQFIVALILTSISVSGLADASFLTREEWLRRVRREINNTLCEAGGYLKVCTDITPATCTARVESANDKCVAKIKFPNKIDPLDDGITYGNKLGQCVGRNLEKEVKRRPATLSSVCEIAL